VRLPPTAAALACGLLAGALLAWNGSHRPNLALDDLRPAGRYWEDLALAGSTYLQRATATPGPVIVNGTPEAEDLKHGFRRNLLRGVEELALRPWQFWRTVPVRPFLNRARVVQRPYEDGGRPLLMAAGYRLLGGVAPYLGLWVALLFALPSLLWTTWELARAGWPLAAGVFALAVGSSCFAADLLTMAYAATGFHLVALLLLAALACHAFLARPGTVAALLARCLAGGLLFLVCLLCRASSLALVPALLLSVGVAAWRLAGGRASWRRGAALALLAGGVFLGPYALLRALAKPSAHDVWATVWEGLGDFDRSKGFVWSDPELRAFLQREGLPVSPLDGMEFQGPASEAVTRRAVVTAIRQDPLWYGGILARRLGATLTLWKLRPWGPRDGRSLAPATHPNEGSTDVYWGMTATADFFGAGPWRQELGLSVVLAPLVLLPLLWGLSPRARQPATRAGAAAQLGALATLSLGTMAIPIGVGTASGFELQSHVLVPLLALGLLVQGLAEGAGRRPAP
jgi:hypothetical protein